MKLLKALRRRTEGSAAVEFAIAAPVLLLMIIGLLELGIMFSANAGLQNAVDEGARFATIYPRPSDADIAARVRSRKFGLQASRVGTPTIVHGTVDGTDYAEVTLTYSMPVNFVFFHAPDVTLSRTRRAYLP